MARGVNKVILIGNLGDDPDLRYTGSGTAVCNMSLATNETYTDRDGNEVQQTEWHKVVAWGRKGEVMNEYLSKGSQVYIEGKLQTNEWEEDGKTRYQTEVKAREFTFLDGLEQNGQGSQSQRHGSSQQSREGRQSHSQGEPQPQHGGGAGPAQGESQTSQEEEPFSPNDDLPF